MMKRTSLRLTACALCALVGFLSFVTGCGREEKKPPTAAPSTPSAAVVDDYMKDPAFQKTLADGRAARNELSALVARLRGEMVAKVDAMRAAMPGADDAAVKAALEKDAAWNELHHKMEDAVKAIDYERKKLTAKVGERIAPKRTAKSADAEAAARQVADAKKTVEAVRQAKTAAVMEAVKRGASASVAPVRDEKAKEEISK